MDTGRKLLADKVMKAAEAYATIKLGVTTSRMWDEARANLRAAVDELAAIDHHLKGEPQAAAQSAIPEGWVPLRIEYEPGYPEDVAFGPQRMMDRLKKWLDKFFEMRLATPPKGEPQAGAQPGQDAPLAYMRYSEASRSQKWVACGPNERGAFPVYTRAKGESTTPAERRHVGDSDFEGWFSEYNGAGKGTKQQMRDAYAAGLRDIPPSPQPEERKALVEKCKRLADEASQVFWREGAGGLFDAARDARDAAIDHLASLTPPAARLTKEEIEAAHAEWSTQPDAVSSPDPFTAGVRFAERHLGITPPPAQAKDSKQ